MGVSMACKKTFWISGLTFTLLTIYSAAPARSQTSQPGEAQEGISRRQADEILSELKEIRTELQKLNAAVASPRTAAAPVREKVEMNASAEWHAIGKDNAPVTLIEFLDYQCPFCRRFHSDAFGELKKNYIDTGKVRFISRDLPLELHPFSLKAAEAARCAGDQGKYWEMRDALLVNSTTLSDDTIAKLAESLSINNADFRGCLTAERHKADVQKDSKEAATIQIRSTPTFVLARSGKDKLDGIKIVGAQSYAAFQALIDEMLKN
jgi:protein-disulfide isomerase